MEVDVVVSPDFIQIKGISEPSTTLPTEEGLGSTDSFVKCEACLENFRIENIQTMACGIHRYCKGFSSYLRCIQIMHRMYEYLRQWFNLIKAIR